ncbi:MAG: HAD family phosphatase [Candidatus Paceibacterota bacterium]
MSSIKSICFDLDGVYFTPKGKNSFHQALIEEYGASKEVIDDLMRKSVEMAKLVRGQISPTDFWKRVREITGIKATDEELTARWVRDYEVNPDVQAVVRKVKAAGYKTCVCTNNNGIRLPILVERFHLLEDFDAIVSSHEIGETKPHKEIFQALLARLNIKPEELIYSDDNSERLAGASDLGIQTFVYENFKQFVGELRKRGITV